MKVGETAQAGHELTILQRGADKVTLSRSLILNIFLITKARLRVYYQFVFRFL